MHVAVSLDGATTGFRPDVRRFYELAGRFSEDVTLAGADTILAQEPMLADAPMPGPSADGPLLAVVDGRRRVSAWDALRDCGHWRDVVALRTAGPAPAETGGPQAPRAGTGRGAGVREVAAGEGRVDLAATLDLLEGDVIRVDSGGGLNGALLRAGLVHEVSLLVHPCIVGGDPARWHGSAPALPLEPADVERFDGGLVWLRYRLGSRLG
ncbi:hypothetical protein GCM10010182_59880 [Actinomadura cremea]|nr:hypothetical protein GCM10010182_59880 [Actinomadura cremea]